MSFPPRPRRFLQIIEMALLLLSVFCCPWVASQPQDHHQGVATATHRSLFLEVGPLCLFGGDRCGFLGLFQSMHRINAETGACEDVCVWIPFLHPDYQCGYCPIDNGVFNIDIDLTGVPENDHPFFQRAKAFWESVIVGDKPEERSNFLWLFWLFAISLLVPSCQVPDRVDDLFICASYQKIDGAFIAPNIVGAAAPLINANGFPVVGIMFFDGSDIPTFKSEGTVEFGEIILHEM